MTDPGKNALGKDPRPFYARTRFLVFALLVMAVYGYGWRVTEIDLGELVRDVHLVKPLVRDLLHPDLFIPNTESLTVEARFRLTGPSDFPRPAPPSPGNHSKLALSAPSGRIGDRLTVMGKDLPPRRRGQLFWVNAIEQEFPLGAFETDVRGSFSRQIVVPEIARGEDQTVRATLTWKTGGWRMSHTLKLAAGKMVETLFLALMATTLAIVVAAPLSFLGARNLMTRHLPGTTVYYLVRTVFNVLRSIEPLIMAILFAVWVGIGPFAGVLALGVHSTAALGKLFSEQIESIDSGPVEAITATGANPMQVVLYAVVPQVVPQFLALSFYRWDINVRMSTIIGFVGGGGIGFLLQQWINLLQYNQAGTALLAIACVVITLDTLSARIREKITQ
ncbi:MAG: phosphonate ABC transporter, permease protein PhnE [Nitrospinaceae bacterium]